MLVQHILDGKPAGVETISPTATIRDAAAVLSRRKIGALVVSEDGSILRGILSERDIVRELGERGAECLNDQVRDLMTAKVESCIAAEPTDAVLERMTTGRFRHMPVVDEGKVTGIISIGDVVKARIEMMESENLALTEMIKGF
ncbi:MAG: CBS domain-containing protein [Pseudomonadota bacterium]